MQEGEEARRALGEEGIDDVEPLLRAGVTAADVRAAGKMADQRDRPRGHPRRAGLMVRLLRDGRARRTAGEQASREAQARVLRARQAAEVAALDTPREGDAEAADVVAALDPRHVVLVLEHIVASRAPRHILDALRERDRRTNPGWLRWLAWAQRQHERAAAEVRT